MRQGTAGQVYSTMIRRTFKNRRIIDIGVDQAQLDILNAHIFRKGGAWTEIICHILPAGHHCELMPPGSAVGSVGLEGWLASSPLGARRFLLSPVYMIQPVVNCFSLLMHWMPCACALALARAGSSIAARMAMMAMTTSNSMSVNPKGAIPFRRR